MQQVVKSYLKQVSDFLRKLKQYFRNHNHKQLKNEIKIVLKDITSISRKRRLIHKKLQYQMRQLSQMEKLIAQNNEHTFLRGNKFNELR